MTTPSAGWLHNPYYRDQLLQAAHDYAEQGWHVFPLRPGTKRPAVPNHPAHSCDRTDPKCADGHTGWEERATADHHRITTAWTRHPWGIGIACGPSELLVVDLDVATDSSGRSGIDTWVELTRTEALDATYTVDTPSGGQHRYYRRPAGLALGNTVAALGPRIDTRSAGGYVVAPPTRLSKGEVYKVTSPRTVAPLPRWLTEALATSTAPSSGPHPPPPRPPVDPAPDGSERLRRYVEAALDDSAAQLQAITVDGQRNNTLFTVARSLGQLIGAGALDEHVAERVLWANTTHFIPIGDCTQAELAATIASGLRSGQRHPRHLPAELTNELHQQAEQGVRS